MKQENWDKEHMKLDKILDSLTLDEWEELAKRAENKGGFVDYEPPTAGSQCLSPEHNPPTHIVLETGKHTYKCPSCGKVTIVNVPKIR